MHRIFQAFIDRVAESVDPVALRDATADAAAALDLSCFAYLSMPHRRGAEARVVSTYPAAWTGHYVDGEVAGTIRAYSPRAPSSRWR